LTYLLLPLQGGSTPYMVWYYGGTHGDGWGGFIASQLTLSPAT
jgi:hypothetical protein